MWVTSRQTQWSIIVFFPLYVLFYFILFFFMLFMFLIWTFESVNKYVYLSIYHKHL